MWPLDHRYILTYYKYMNKEIVLGIKIGIYVLSRFWITFFYGNSLNKGFCLLCTCCVKQAVCRKIIILCIIFIFYRTRLLFLIVLSAGNVRYQESPLWPCWLYSSPSHQQCTSTASCYVTLSHDVMPDTTVPSSSLHTFLTWPFKPSSTTAVTGFSSSL